MSRCTLIPPLVSSMSRELECRDGLVMMLMSPVLSTSHQSYTERVETGSERRHNFGPERRYKALERSQCQAVKHCHDQASKGLEREKERQIDG